MFEIDRTTLTLYFREYLCFIKMINIKQMLDREKIKGWHRFEFLHKGIGHWTVNYTGTQK